MALSFSVAAFIPLIALVASATWSYTGTGDSKAAAQWADMVPACGGEKQSPIDIVVSDADHDEDLTPFVFNNYAAPNPAPYQYSNAHSAKVTFNSTASGVMPSISGGGLVGTYNFLQFHMHWGRTSAEGSEHVMNGMAYPAEIHMVHLNSKYSSFEESIPYADAAAVLGIMIDVGEEDNEDLEVLIDNLGNITYSEDEVEIAGFALDVLLPKDDIDVFFRYHGSLTTPGCFEIVTWTVFREPIHMSETQLKKLRSHLMFNKEGETDDALSFNFRPIQALNSRKVTTSLKPMDDGASSVAFSCITMATMLLSALFFM